MLRRLDIHGGGAALGLDALAQDLLELAAEFVVVVLRLPGAGHRLDQLFGHLLFLGRDAVLAHRAGRQLEVLRVHHFLLVAQQQQDQRIALRHHRRQVFARADHHLGDAHLAGVAQRLAQQHVALFGLLARHQDVGLFEIARVDVGGIDKGFHLHRLVALRRGRADVLLLDDDIAALVVLEGLDDLLPRHFIAGVGVDALEADRLLVARIEHAEMQVHLALARHQRHRHIEQAERQGSGPDRSCHRRVTRVLFGVAHSCSAATVIHA